MSRAILSRLQDGGYDLSGPNFTGDNRVWNCPSPPLCEGEGSLREAVDGPVVGAVAEEAGLFEILCRGPSKCGTFASVRPLDACPKCGSPKVVRRAAEPPSKTKT